MNGSGADGPDSADGTGSAPADGPGPGVPRRVRTVPAHDELHHEGESLVLVEGHVQRVSPLGTLIRATAVQGSTVAELAAVLEEAFGAPEGADALALTEDAVRTMLNAGLLEDC